MVREDWGPWSSFGLFMDHLLQADLGHRAERDQVCSWHARGHQSLKRQSWSCWKRWLSSSHLGTFQSTHSGIAACGQCEVFLSRLLGKLA